MAGRVQGKKVLITGAAQGLGAASSMLLAREGAKVLCTDINEEGAQATAAAINAECGAGTAFAQKLDVTSPDDWKAAVETARTAMGGLSVLSTTPGSGYVGISRPARWKNGVAVLRSMWSRCSSAARPRSRC